MKVYIFGAGASLASQNDEYSLASSSRAPLINELFDGRYKELALYMLSEAEINEFRSEIEARSDKSVEGWLEEKWNSIQNIKTIAKKNSQIRLFGHKVMYIWNVMRIVSNTYNERSTYKNFLKNLLNLDVDFGIVSFNYDTLLDRAFEQVFHKTFRSIDHYLEENFVKPHGSINWLLDKRDTDPAVPLNNDISLRINMAMDQFFSNGSIPFNKLRVVSPSLESLRNGDVAQVWRDLGMDYFYPLIFLPLAKKKLDHFTNFSEQIIEKGKEILGKAEEIYVIGYRAKDEIIKLLFKYAPDGTPLHVVSDSHAKEISEDIRKVMPNLKKGIEFDGGFTLFNRQNFLIE